MGLICWLPLMGTLENKGISNITVTNNGATVDTSGKIGSCYSFNGNNYYISLVGQQLFDCFKGENQQFSMCMWVYHADSRRAVLFGDWNLSNSIGFNIELSTGHGVRFYWNGSPDYSPGINVGASIWSHITFTYDGTALRSYLNGNLIATRSGALAARSKTAGEFRLGRDNRTTETALNGKLNDVRIYKDHCLSAAEVREISQGLVLHYKLDNLGGGFGNPNLCKNSRTFGTGWSGSGAITQNAFEGFAVKYKDNTSGTSYTDTVGYSNVLTVNPNEIYTLSFWAKADSPHDVTCFFYNNSSGVVQSNQAVSNTGTTGTAADGRIAIHLTTEWEYYWITWTFASSGTAASKHIIIGRNAASQSGISVTKVKLERGNSATPWAPHPNDGEAITNYIEDSSGYNHNGEIFGDLITVSDTQRYSYATKWNCSDPTTNNATGKCYIKAPLTLYTPLQMSVSWWAKPENGYGSSVAHAAFCTSNGDSYSAPTDYNRTAFHHRDGAFDIYPSDASGVKRLTLAYTKDEWHHYVVTYDGTTAKVYKDGTEAASVTVGTNKTLSTFTLIYIGYSQAGGVQRKTLGTYSDFRVYCTALDADAIRQLYQVGAKVDNKGNLHAFEINEFGENQLTKTGIIKDYMVEPYKTLPDGSHWQLMLFHYVDGGNNLFTQSNATYCNDFGLYSRLRDINNFTYNNGYEFYVIQDGIEYRWTQTSQPTASSIAGKTVVSGYADPVNGLAKASQSNTYIGYSSWWGACGCWTSYTVSGKTGIPGFGAHTAAGICAEYLALYARIPDSKFKLATQNAYASNFIEI